TSDYDPRLIIRRDNTIRNCRDGSAIARLEKMAGLKDVKEKVHSLMNFHKLQKLRSEAGLPVKQPSLHARFLGNPGTGKTTVARLLGQIYKEMGLLSSGHVVLEERKNMIGRYYDSEGQAVENALNRAKGGILLIDEAYNLYVKEDEKDPGRRILEYLLTALSDEENRDWMLILAGYPDEMEAMLESNPGIKSRVNESFTFEDFSVDELMQIAELYCDDNKYELSEEARERLRSVVARDVAAKDKHFGNGRYVKKLMETAINTRMATRISKIDSPTFDQLVTIEADDIPISQEEAERISTDGFDNEAIDGALKRLDSLVGLGKVKSAIHNFVSISRYLNSQGDRYRGKGLLKWNFTGNTGTGKSTVAQILADILKAMNLVQNSEITEVKGEEIFNVSDYECNEVIRSAVKRSRKGVLFIDGDAPEFRSSRYRLTSEQVRFKLATLASEDNSSGALIIAECTTPNLSIAHSLASNGVYDFDHTFIFDDYTAEELYDILLQCLDGYKAKVSAEAETILREYIANLCANRELSFANARTMKNLSRAIFETLVLRLSDGKQGEERVVLAQDVDSFVWRRKTVKLGF
ncbi:MAG: AAA family ATPase, partial [Bacteroidaceae bacterium]|nr:AAA family ATPase [Bacteroidaceae bacterium]